jgi:hypothetical protein
MENSESETMNNKSTLTVVFVMSAPTPLIYPYHRYKNKDM